MSTQMKLCRATRDGVQYAIHPDMECAIDYQDPFQHLPNGGSMPLAWTGEIVAGNAPWRFRCEVDAALAVLRWIWAPNMSYEVIYY